MDLKSQIRAFISDNFLYRDDRETVADNESLLEAGLIDSTGVLELVAFLEGTFGVVMADADIVPENLDSIEAIAGYLVRKGRIPAVAA